MRLIIAIAAGVCLASPAAAATQTWKIDPIFDGAHYPLTCKLAVKSGGMSGVCRPAAAGVKPLPVPASGTYTDKTWDLTYQADLFGRRITVSYKGLAQADGSISGTVDSDGRAGTFTAVR